MIKFLLKWVINGAIAVSFLMYYSSATFWGAVLAATGLTVIAYLLGDQLILRASNNAAATFADFVLTVLYFMALTYMFDWNISWGEAIFLAVLIGVAEWILHRYVFREAQVA